MLTRDQLRSAVFEVFAGRVPKLPGIEFDTFTSLKIGVRHALAAAGIMTPQPPGAYPADTALNPAEEMELSTVFKELEAEGAIRQTPDGRRFVVELVPRPFAQRWQFLGSLRGGGQSRTIKVRSLTSNVLGVLKLPNATDDISIKRFQREVRIVEEIIHPSIMHLLDHNLDESAGHLGYVTPLGVPLDDYWNALADRLTPLERYDAAYTILREICLGLSLVHERQLVHRDLKPENIVMLGNQPVVIDFGVAIGPEDERLTQIDGRLVANRSTTPPSAHYGLHPNSPAWDSYSLACIYGYLLGPSPRAKQFHWRFHQLVPEGRSERLRSLLAEASIIDHCPPNAAEFLKQMDYWKLSGQAVRKPQVISYGRAAAAEVFLEAKAQRALSEAEEMERIEVDIQVIAALIEDLRSLLQRECTGTAEMPIRQYPNPKPAFAPTRPVRDIMREVFDRRRRSGTPNADAVMEFFACLCGSPPKQFLIRVDLFYQARVDQGKPRYGCRFWYQNLVNGKAAIQRELAITGRGTFAELFPSQTYSVDTAARIAIDWTRNPQFWAEIA
jgi:serine/threonine protein kinase